MALKIKNKKVDSLVIVCYNVIKGGGVTIVFDFINYCISIRKPIVILCPKSRAYYALTKIPKNDEIKIVWFPVALNFILFKPFINYIFLPIFCAIYGTEKVFNFGNVGFPTSKKQFLLMHNAFAVCKDERIYKRFPLKSRVKQKLMNWFIRINIIFPDVVAVQTNSIKTKIDEFISTESILIPNLINRLVLNRSCYRVLNKEKEIKMLFLSKYYTHKNFEIIIPLAKLINERRLPFKIVLTLDKDEQADENFLSVLSRENLQSIVENIGYIEQERLKEIYNDCDALFLPTLMESFSGTYIEAMCYGKPIFTSNRDFAKEICGEEAFYFDPYDRESILNTFSSAFLEMEKVIKFTNVNQNKIHKMQSELFSMSEKIYRAL